MNRGKDLIWLREGNIPVERTSMVEIPVLAHRALHINFSYNYCPLGLESQWSGHQIELQKKGNILLNCSCWWSIHMHDKTDLVQKHKNIQHRTNQLIRTMETKWECNRLNSRIYIS